MKIRDQKMEEALSGLRKEIKRYNKDNNFAKIFSKYFKKANRQTKKQRK